MTSLTARGDQAASSNAPPGGGDGAATCGRGSGEERGLRRTRGNLDMMALGESENIKVAQSDCFK